MYIHFGLSFDDIIFQKEKNNNDALHVGAKGFLNHLETIFGMAGDADDNEYLRIERYRQAILTHLKSNTNTFYEKSFEADAFGVANFLLQRRDEAKLAGWDFSIQEAMPKRLKILAELELLLHEFGGIERGFADRFLALEHSLHNSENIDFKEKIILHDELSHYPFYWQRLLSLFDYSVVEYDEKYTQNTDLEHFKQKISSNPELQKVALKNDGSLLIIKGKRETDLADFLAKAMSEMPDFQPLCLIPEANQLLDNAIEQEGLPRMGIASSASRPVQQLLKLVSVFLWRPIDPFRIMEFLTMSIKPLDDRLAHRLAGTIASKPGLLSDDWFFTLRKFEEDTQAKIEAGAEIDFPAIMKQFRFWFDRARYDSLKSAPKRDILDIYEYLEKWALETFSSNPRQKSLLTLSEQARKIKELLEELPETFLSRLELDRIVKTIYRPSPVTIYEREVAALPYIHQPGALAATSENTVWWNFTDHSPQQNLSLWKKEELIYFADNEVFIENVEKKNALYLAQQKRPILFAEKKLVLIIPAQTNGADTMEHPLMGYLHSVFEHLSPITYDIDKNNTIAVRDFIFPPKEKIEQQALLRTEPFIVVENILKNERERESLTSLEDLIYYPHKWAFKYQAKFFPSAILSISSDKKLMGNLAHRAFELMFKESISTWQKSDVNTWIDENVQKLLRQEGAVLLMYGKEQERQRFISTLKYSAWNLISMINNNNWTVKKSEFAMENEFADTKVKGIADLILQRGEDIAIIDLKWGGFSYRRDLINNQEDLQLVMYTHLLADNQAHTAYYIIESGQMLVRNLNAFKEGKLIPKEALNHVEVHRNILTKMEKTYLWRKSQLAEGNIEVRTSNTKAAIESTYEDLDMLDFLEMKDSESNYDDYRVLIGAVN